MQNSSSRRRFIQQASTLAGTAMLPGLQPLTADDTKLDSKIVQFHPEAESLVRLIEETPRQRLLEEIGTRVKSGLSYRELLAHCFLPAFATCSRVPPSVSSSTLYWL